MDESFLWKIHKKKAGQKEISCKKQRMGPVPTSVFYEFCKLEIENLQKEEKLCLTNRNLRV